LIGQVQYRFYGKVSKDLNKKWTLGFQTNPRLYGYTKYEDGQRALLWKNHMVVSYQAFDRLGINTYLGHSHYNYNTGARFEEDKRPIDWKDPYDNDDGVYLEIEFESALNDNITLIGLISQEHDLRDPEPTSFLRSDETTYFIIGVISI